MAPRYNKESLTCRPQLSVVSPVYGSPDSIKILCSRLKDSLSKLTDQYEVILVFDCSPDDGWSHICSECSKDDRIKGIKLSRNFGQHYAITAGLQNAKGEWIVVMDCDLQDQPEEIPPLFRRAQEGFDIVFAQRKERQDTYLKRVSSKLFYAIFSYMTDSKQDASIANFGIYHHDTIDALLSMNDRIRYFPAMIQWVGFNSTVLPVSHGVRENGNSTYTWRSLFKLAFDNMIAFSDKPLRLTVRLGMLICGTTIAFSLWLLIRYFWGGIIVSGYTSIILSIWFLAGIVIYILGVIGTYLGCLFDQTKNRPTFIIQSKVNMNEN